MRFLIFGKNGQVATSLRQEAQGFELYQFDSQQVPFTDAQSVARCIRQVQPTHIINASAYTAVDQAEKEKELAYQVNAEILTCIGEEARKTQAFVVHFSTDYVFDGQKDSAYTEEDQMSPINYYGVTKAAGEQKLIATGCAHLILRVSWVYSASGKNFLKTILRLAQEKTELKIVNDQKGAPTSSDEIAQAVFRLLQDPSVREKQGIYHLTPAGETTWFDYAHEIVRLAKLQPERFQILIKNLIPVSSSEYPTPAQRPKNSVMSSQKLKQNFKIELPDWQTSLNQVFQKI